MAEQTPKKTSKRGKKDSESPSLTEERQQKRGKHDSLGARKCLQLKPQPNEQLPESGTRILPEFLQAKSAEPSKGVLVIAKSGLRNSEVCSKVS